MPTETRARKLGKRIGVELAELLLRDVDDPRLAMVTVTEVNVDRELAFATIYVTTLTGGEDRDEILRAFEGARGFLRSQLASRIQLRSFPQLRFRWDQSPDRGARIEELLQKLRDEGGQSKDDV
jgi:ribosome-binding factor A